MNANVLPSRDHDGADPALRICHRLRRSSRRKTAIPLSGPAETPAPQRKRRSILSRTALRPIEAMAFGELDASWAALRVPPARSKAILSVRLPHWTSKTQPRTRAVCVRWLRRRSRERQRNDCCESAKEPSGRWRAITIPPEPTGSRWHRRIRSERVRPAPVTFRLSNNRFPSKENTRSRQLPSTTAMCDPLGVAAIVGYSASTICRVTPLCGLSSTTDVSVWPVKGRVLRFVEEGVDPATGPDDRFPPDTRE